LTSWRTRAEAAVSELEELKIRYDDAIVENEKAKLSLSRSEAEIDYLKGRIDILQVR
jgi:hypothetical protein